MKIIPYKFRSFDSNIEDQESSIPNNAASNKEFIPDANADKIKEKIFQHFEDKNASKEITYTEQDLIDKENESFQKGLLQGREEEKNVNLDIEKQSIACLGNILDNIQKLHNAAIDDVEQKNTDIIKLSVTIAKKIADKALLDNHIEIMEKTIFDCLKLIHKEPSLIIKINETLLETISAKIENIVKDSNFEGNVSILADNNISCNNCILQWDEGGLEVSIDDKKEQIDQILSSL